jgi:hypothetical protein
MKSHSLAHCLWRDEAAKSTAVHDLHQSRPVALVYLRWSKLGGGYAQMHILPCTQLPPALHRLRPFESLHFLSHR